MRNNFIRSAKLKMRGMLSMLMLMSVMPAAHAENLSVTIKRLTGLGNDAIWFLQVGAIVIGIVMIISGILLIIKNQKSGGNGQVSNGAAAMIVVLGGALAWVSSLIDTAGDTLWGEGGSRERITIPTN